MSMARTSRTEKAKTRQRILAQAARALRVSGVRGVSVPGLMKSVGLTHGTFYAHFASKDALVAETYAECIDGATDVMMRSAEATPGHGAVEAFLATYLGAAHRDDVGRGCFFPAMAAEVQREPPEARAEFSNALSRFYRRVGAVLSKQERSTHPDDELVLASGVVGAILLARAVEDPALSDRILHACRTFYAAAFADSSE
jgi:TetR/AcrR family transcriptional regulator, transcriptional repressor for nem operon